ncbi:MAG: hypothetical protein IJC50_10070 [Clostridia bacterium]|nr:hypothetical protein [Clostridia bacterium]
MSKKKKVILLCLAVIPFVLKILLFLDDYISVFAGSVIFLLITAVNMIFTADKDTFVKHNVIAAAAWLICELTSWYLYSFVIQTKPRFRNNWMDIGMGVIGIGLFFAVVVTVIAAIMKSAMSDKK